MNATINAIKAQITEALKHDTPRPAEVIAKLEVDNVALRSRITALELLLVSSVGVLLAPARSQEVVALHIADIRRALSAQNEAPR